MAFSELNADGTILSGIWPAWWLSFSKPEGSRASLIQDAAFAEAFLFSKARLRMMHVRVVEESNPLRQALLEMYVAIELEASYNDFDNH